MKVILSRKGFDSGSGGCPSPILPDGSMLSLPIPDDRSPVRYQDLSWRGHNVGALVEQLSKGKVQADHGAHLDPDLRVDQLPRHADWRPLLGQVGAAQGHLKNQGVGVGDVFLFWGLFRPVDSRLRWTGPPLHAIWGWMQIGEVVAVDAVRAAPTWRWANRHPHFSFEANRTNTFYAGARKLTAVDESLVGAGVFDRLTAAQTLTAPGASSHTVWSLPRWTMPKGKTAMSYHGNASRWTMDEDRVRLHTVSRGQEFVLDCADYPEALKWVEGLVASGLASTGDCGGK